MATLIDSESHPCLTVIQFMLPDGHAQAWHQQSWSHVLVLSIQHLGLLVRAQLPRGNLPKQVSVSKRKLQGGLHVVF